MAVSGSPESDFGSFECFQNYTAPEVFVQGLAGQINQQDVEAIIRAQKQMLQRFEKTNEMLSNCNSLSYSRFALAQKELKKHTTLMHDMKKDLDNIFKRIRNLKAKLSSQYPAAYSEAQDKFLKEENEDDSDSEKSVTKVGLESAPHLGEYAASNLQTAPGFKLNDEQETTPVDDRKQGNLSRHATNSSSCDSMSSNSAKISSSSSFDN